MEQRRYDEEIIKRLKDTEFYNEYTKLNKAKMYRLAAEIDEAKVYLLSLTAEERDAEILEEIKKAKSLASKFPREH